MPKPEVQRFTGYQLISPTVEASLHGYIFQNEKHARDWFAQPGTARDPRYRLAFVSYRKRKCCGAPFAFKRLRTIDVEEFVKGGSLNQ